MSLLEGLKKLTKSGDFKSLGVNIGPLTTSAILKAYGNAYPPDRPSPQPRARLDRVDKMHEVKGIKWEHGA